MSNAPTRAARAVIAVAFLCPPAGAAFGAWLALAEALGFSPWNPANGDAGFAVMAGLLFGGFFAAIAVPVARISLRKGSPGGAVLSVLAGTLAATASAWGFLTFVFLPAVLAT